MNAIILAGGTGTRLWPVSRKTYPKQFLTLNEDQTLLKRTVKRVSKHVDNIVIATNQEQFFHVRDDLEDLVLEDNILPEPCRRDTAPAILLATLCIKEIYGDEPILVLPSDQILDNEFFEELEPIEKHLDDYLVTFGVEPNQVETGYGYIDPGEELDRGIHHVERFVEKPSHNVAKNLIEAGCLWNAGIFLFKPSTLLKEVNKHAPDLAQNLDTFNTFQEHYHDLPTTSLDYAIMEKSNTVATVPHLGEWNDIGDWSTVHDILPIDLNGNATKGTPVLKDVKDSLVYVDDPDRTVAAIGINNLLIIDTADALLVAPKNRAQDVKKIVNTLKEQGRDVADTHLTVHRPWGHYTTLEKGNRYQVKRLTIHPGQNISLQRHLHRAEHWIVVKGTAKVTKNKNQFYLHENESTYIPKTTTHRLKNPGKTPLHIIETQTGEYLEEDDIERFNDDYGRSIGGEET